MKAFRPFGIITSCRFWAKDRRFARDRRNQRIEKHMLTKRFADKKTVIRRTVIVLLALGFLVFLYFINQVQKPELVTSVGRSFERARVVEVVKDNLQEDGRRYGEQQLRLLMLSGPKKGETVEATSAAGYLFGAGCTPGMNVITIQSVSGDISVTSVYTADREGVIYVFVLLFFVVLCLIAGKQGIKSSVSLIFTLACIFWLYLPLVFRGFSPFWAAVAVAAVTTVVTMYLIGGPSKKTVCSIIGTVSAVIIAGAAATAFGFFAGISGYNVSDIESLLFLAESTKIQVGGLLFSGLLIASLGAAMDVAMSVASTINEIHEKNPRLGRRELFASGINVGRDMMGTMSTTLILAFAGGSITMLVSNYVYDLPYIQIINSYGIGIEIMQAFSGSLGVILAVPIVAAVSAFSMVPAHASSTQAPGKAAETEMGAEAATAMEPAPATETVTATEAVTAAETVTTTETATAAETEAAAETVTTVKAEAPSGEAGNSAAAAGIPAGTALPAVLPAADSLLPALRELWLLLRRRWKLVTALVCLFVLLLCCLRFYTVYAHYQNGSREYAQISQTVSASPSSPSSSELPEDLAQSSEVASEPERFTFDYQKLADQNSDAVGWLRLPETKLSYPILQGKDNAYYLDHTFYKNQNEVGAIFMDSRIKEGFAADQAILYGHNMRDGSMFAELCKYRSQEYFEEHRYLELYGKNGRAICEVFSAHETAPDGETYTRSFPDKSAYESYLKKMKELSLYDTGVKVTASNRILTLSTCVSDDRDMRFVVHAKVNQKV